MSPTEMPCLKIAIARLKHSQPGHFAFWVLQAPYPSGHSHHDRIWPTSLSQAWSLWQQLFCPESILPNFVINQIKTLPTATISPSNNSSNSQNYSSRLMQELGLNLWEWLFDEPIQSSLDQSRGIAIGQNQPLRLRLDIREPELITLPWEIMLSQQGKPAISLTQQILFSRTTSDVENLANDYQPANELKILLVLGNAENLGVSPNRLQLEKEGDILAKLLENSHQKDAANNYGEAPAACYVQILLQPTPDELIKNLETGNYNIFFYAGHGTPGTAGGLLYLQKNLTISGTELAQVLVKGKVTLALFNACWGAQPATEVYNSGEENLSGNDSLGLVPRSSLAEVLLHHGVPAVLAMRDQISDAEALSFIEAFTKALGERMTIDRAVYVARQQLLTKFKFNQPAWTLPVLYMHPEFNGKLLKELSTTVLPPTSFSRENVIPSAYLKLIKLDDNESLLNQQAELNQVWLINQGLIKVGRQTDNDVVVNEKWVSSKHAEIFCRHSTIDENTKPKYFLKDFSRYGTLVLVKEGWQRVHHQEQELRSGCQIKFGSSHGRIFEFMTESNE